MITLAEARLYPGLAILCTVVAAALSVPPLRSIIEQSMAWHMVFQMPLLVMGGWLAGRAGRALLPLGRQEHLVKHQAKLLAEHLAKFNYFGLTGFMAAQAIVAYWMLPTAIDRAVVNPGFDAIKLLTLFVSGLLLRGAFMQAPLALQLFFMGYWVSMMCWLGIYFATTDLRLCNAYSQASQVTTGWALLALGLMLGSAWLGFAVYRSTANARLDGRRL